MTKRKKRATEGDRLRAEVFRRFDAAGDFGGLGVLADYLDERGESPEFAALLRKVMNGRDPAVRFFYLHAGGSYRPDRESVECGRLRNAVALSRAEEWFECREWGGEPLSFSYVGGPHYPLNFRWELDPDYNPDDYDSEMPDEGWEGYLQVYTPRGWVTLQSMGGVTFNGGPESDPCARVVRAELCREELAHPTPGR